ncbi:zinc finger protein 28-like [Danaus plexippus]|uniref:zinc finger protein 28-like n=1 Tax=Danaus plexippus TaxID=13037 RepID=UPI002AB23C31|nr:zinc finger protein 28-like [Danaus plexippus]
MEEKRKNKLFDLCRLCLVKRGFCDISDRNELCDNIHKCTGLKISASDKLPQKICRNCLDIVNKASELRNMARKNDKHLRSLFDCPVEDPEPEFEAGSSSEKSEIVLQETERKCFSLAVRQDLFNKSKTNDEEDSEAVNSLNLIHSMKPENEDTDSEYKCPVCSKNFAKWRKLYVHHRLHNKCYKCPIDICIKRFATKGDLEKHIRTHTGEKPYVCNECEKRFAQRGTLKAHKESVHPVT